MNLTKTQLYIQERADKTLSFWCIVWSKDISLYWDIIEYWKVNIVWTFTKDSNSVIKSFCVMNQYTENLHRFNFENDVNNYTIIWHPMTYGRLMYLARMNDVELPLFEDLFAIFPEYYQCTLLGRPGELCEMVLKFLESLPKKTDE